MSDRHIDHESVRARVEKRLEPRMRLLRRRFWLFVHMLIFVAGMVLIYSGDRSNSMFFHARSYTSVVRDGMRTYQIWEPYQLVIFLSWSWLLLLILHALSMWAAFGRERIVQREMDREMELEKMRLQLDLSRVNSAEKVEGEREKPKRVASLSDDGELVFEDEPMRRNAGHRDS